MTPYFADPEAGRTKLRVLDDPEHAPGKPREGQPCNGCGFCCAAEACSLAIKFLGVKSTDLCPAIEFGEGRFWCGLVRNPRRYLHTGQEFDRALSQTFTDLLGIGKGCDSADFDGEGAAQ